MLKKHSKQTRSSRKSRTGRRVPRRLSIERVEERRLMAADVWLGNGSLLIWGSDQSDVASVEQVGDQLRVRSKSEGDAAVQTTSYPARDVRRIYFVGRGGDDLFANETALPTYAWGQDGDDLLVGGSGTNYLVGGNGNDGLLGGNAADTLYGGDGDDIIVGRGGDDRIYGGNGNDRIGAGYGNDMVDGESGTDTIFGGAGNDTLDGGLGDDFIRGDEGDDAVRGGAGHDLLVGAEGADDVRGGDGDDVLFGGTGNDRLKGEQGDDIVFGGDGVDWIWGDAGNDQLFGGADMDVLFGGVGDDTLDGGTGYDWTFGEAGSDQLYDADRLGYRTSGQWRSGPANATLSATQGGSAIAARLVDAFYFSSAMKFMEQQASMSSGSVASGSSTNGGAYDFAWTYNSAAIDGSGAGEGLGSAVGDGIRFSVPRSPAWLVRMGAPNARRALLDGGYLNTSQVNNQLSEYLGMSLAEFNRSLLSSPQFATLLNIPWLAVPGVTY